MRLFAALIPSRPSLAAALCALRSRAERAHTRMSSSSSLPVAAVCQMTATPDKEANFSAGSRLVEQAKEGGACMVFLPEGLDYIGSSRDETLHLSESLEVTLSAATLTWPGELVSVYRKAHLFDVELTSKGVSLKESAFTIPGPRLVPPVQTPIGKVGLGVCYDLRFPELSSALQRHGAEILTYPSAFTVATGTAHWEVLLRARAIETQCFVLAAAQVGAHHAKRTSFGHALAVDPWGEVIGDCGGSDAGLTLVQIDLQRLRDVRRDMPVQRHRRDDRFYCSLD
ncbi:hypothetical protein G5714_008614 [Onychostoma macrolepis]|uniref:CN hydrolase domain-containing protein n=1 Tax=Onychostoma macrolepis TaxID=369639 RepID=A0A7J6CY63_9TELE|nr:hypothetical protein G5714_008614 [Onychostoma macrolepis]